MKRFSNLIFFLIGIAGTAFVLLDPLGIVRPAAMSSGEGSVSGNAGAGSAAQMDRARSQPMAGMGDAVSGARSAGGAAAGKRKILYWYAPMDPTYMRNVPGTSPMGMPMVPKYADEVTGSGEMVEIDPVQVQNIGVVTARAERQDITQQIRTVGILDFNADLVYWVNTKFSGWIEKVYVTYVGQTVTRGQPLFEIYSPELVSTQEEYLRAIDYKKSLDTSDRPEARRQAESLLRSTRERLTYWDISDEQIDQLRSSRIIERRLTIASPVNGTIVNVMDESLEGMFVEPGMNLYKIADLSSVWVHADVYESDLPWIRDGQKARISFPYDDKTVFDGAVLFLYPQLSADTRTLKICVEVPNKSGDLRPGMYATVEIAGPMVRDAVVIPVSAVLRSGERDLVFVAHGHGRFEPREVELGIRGEGDLIQIARGVEPGESVATQSQ
ncbi:MAG: efflux RND transporter periplasmic adaptor subunit, partial [Acidobacteriota bacterium]